MTKARRSAIIITMLLAALPAAGCGGESEDLQDLPPLRTNVNIVVNPGFEEWDGANPVGWELEHLTGEGERVNYYGRSNESAAGSHSYFLRGLYNTEKWMVLKQTHPIRPGHEIFFAADIKTERLKPSKGQEKNANVYVRFLDAEGRRISERHYADAWTGLRAGTSEWKRDTRKTEVPARARFVEIGLINSMTGYAYFDNVELVIHEQIEWKQKKTRFVTFCWLPGRPFPPEEMKRQAALIEDIAGKVGVKRGALTITYYLYPDEESFKKILGRKKYSTIARWDRKELHSAETFNDHDIVYFVLYEMGFPPLGVSHGLGFNFRAQYNGWDLHMRAKEFLTTQQLPALFRTINQDRFRAAEAAIVVPGWGSFVTFLIDRYGMDKLLRLYRETDGIDEAGPFSARFKSIYGIDFQELDRTWRLFLMRYEGDPEAYRHSDPPGEADGGNGPGRR